MAQNAVDSLLEHLAAHERTEEGILEAYEGAARSAPDRGVRFLMDLILEDEERHRRLLSTVTLALQESPESRETFGILPSMAPHVDDMHELRILIDRFLDAEQQGLCALKELGLPIKGAQSPGGSPFFAEELPGLELTAQWLRASPVHLILDIIRADTKRHIRILEHIRRRLAPTNP